MTLWVNCKPAEKDIKKTKNYMHTSAYSFLYYLYMFQESSHLSDQIQTPIDK